MESKTDISGERGAEQNEWQGSPEVGQVFLGDIKKEDSPSIEFRVSIGSKGLNKVRPQVRHVESIVT